jgi:formate dehydrogenase iron-sulfur subunit
LLPHLRVALPLVERAAAGEARFALTAPGSSTAPAAPASGPRVRFPSRAPGPGEQYRFHVDLRACIGCKCCVVACNEQNGNPAAINWRRVAELEGGWYPHARRAYLSMGCNHCIDPTCLTGCPVDAYRKDPATGIVLHSADACIGCQYCTWNCSYGVPQYNPERGVVGKCDLCYGRLTLGQTPACAAACPTGAIGIEIVNVAAWRDEVRRADPGSGVPTGDHSVSTTRISLPSGLPPDMRPAGSGRLAPAEPHWPLVVMTVLTQLSVGAVAGIWLLDLLGGAPRLAAAALGSMATGALALAASVLHLGRPAHAYRALRMWRRSWLSREVLLFSAFSGVACLYALMLWLGLPGAAAAGGLTVALGAAAVGASAQIYRVPSRPSWNTPMTLLEFACTAAVLGPLFDGVVGAGAPAWMAAAAAAAGAATLGVIALRWLRASASEVAERRASARLLATVLAPTLMARGAMLVLGAIALPLAAPAAPWLAAAFVLALGGELAGRYLFFVSAVPVHMSSPYLEDARPL